jgi:hypothetical protein
MVDGAGGPAVLDGDATGWRSVAVPAGLQLSDVHVDERTRAVWVGAVAGKAPMVAQVALPQGRAVTPFAPDAPRADGLVGLATAVVPAPPGPASDQGPVAATRFHGKEF